MNDTIMAIFSSNSQVVHEKSILVFACSLEIVQTSCKYGQADLNYVCFIYYQLFKQPSTFDKR